MRRRIRTTLLFYAPSQKMRSREPEALTVASSRRDLVPIRRVARRPPIFVAPPFGGRRLCRTDGAALDDRQDVGSHGLRQLQRHVFVLARFVFKSHDQITRLRLAREALMQCPDFV